MNNHYCPAVVPCAVIAAAVVVVVVPGVPPVPGVLGVLGVLGRTVRTALHLRTHCSQLGSSRAIIMFSAVLGIRSEAPDAYEDEPAPSQLQHLARQHRNKGVALDAKLELGERILFFFFPREVRMVTM